MLSYIEEHEIDAVGEYLVPDPDEWATVMAAFDRLAEDDSYRSITEETGLAVATISRLAERGRDYYHERVEAPADPVQ